MVGRLPTSLSFSICFDLLVPEQRNSVVQSMQNGLSSPEGKNACCNSRSVGYWITEPNIRKDTKDFETVTNT